VTASYLDLDRAGWRDLVRMAWGEMRECRLCARDCGVNRREGERGFCRTGELPEVASYGPHPGEEAPLRGRGGSGTIFFFGCNLRCEYCQNFDISHAMPGRGTPLSRLGQIMLRLQQLGCPNVNLVSPSHVIPHILGALAYAAERGLQVPLVYNTGGYDSLPGLQLLDGVVDIYMPDMKYQDAEVAEDLSGASDYPEVNQAAIREMHRQVGDLRLDDRGVAKRGLLVRHLVLPNDLAGTREGMQFLADLSPDTFVNIMNQYRPVHRAGRCPGIARPVQRTEYRAAREEAEKAGLCRLYP